jgi:cell division protein FtsQ
MSKSAPRRRRLFPKSWLKPLIVGGMAATLCAGASAGIYLHGARMQEAALRWSAELGFAVADIRVEGRERTSREAILRAVGAERGSPILAVNPSGARATLERLPWVRAASVERLFPDTLHIRIVERTPLALWQNQKKLHLVDREGVVVTTERLERFPGLLVVVGEDAPPHAAALIDMLGQEPDLAKRVAAAVRVGQRRWNLRFDNGIDVQLPEQGAAAAWAQLAKAERAHRVLARDVELIDLRLPDRFVVRTVPEPPKEQPKKGKKST